MYERSLAHPVIWGYIMFPDELVDLRAALEHGQLLLKGLQRGEVL